MVLGFYLRERCNRTTQVLSGYQMCSERNGKNKIVPIKNL